jgi:hypothetical protein
MADVTMELILTYTQLSIWNSFVTIKLTEFILL